MQASLVSALERRLGARVADAARVPGGDINQAYRLQLSDGARVFVKTHPTAPAAMFPAEARGLAWLRAADALRVPDVRAVSEPDEDVRYLVLELIESAKPVRDFDEHCGRGLARLHASAARDFGLDHDNFIGSLAQTNTPHANWAEFYRLQRLEPQLRDAAASGRASYAMRRGFDRLFARLPELVGPAERPSRLHGDLWGGNLHIDERGEPCLIDPAAYAGHREIDLAMMRLFGGFSERVFSAYEESFPLAPGAPERVALYQLYPLMVHLNLFGGSYAASVERALTLYV
jgi:fructosamine-3-kinase